MVAKKDKKSGQNVKKGEQSGQYCKWENKSETGATRKCHEWWVQQTSNLKTCEQVERVNFLEGQSVKKEYIIT